MASLHELVRYTDELLQIERFRDYCPNGLQVEGRSEVTKLVAGVSASQALLEAAIDAGADAILVHHGYFWKGEDPAITGIKQRRIKRLLQADVTLLAYHLPLDGHPELGNNAQLAKRLGLKVAGGFAGECGVEIALHGSLSGPLHAQQLAGLLASVLQRTPMHISPGHDRPISSVGLCSGAAQGYIEQAAALGLDAYISGEISEQTVHLARELGIHYFCAGHHATERYGAGALGQHLADHFTLEFEFIDIENPV